LATKKAKCTGTGGTVYADVLEKYLLTAIREKLAEFNTLSKQEEKRTNPKINENKIRLAEIDKEIDDLMSKVVGANAILMEYINNRVATLDSERKALQNETLELTYKSDDSHFNIISNHVEKWDETSFEDKQAVVDALIKLITVADGNIEITWNI
jgi:hypothetical protein